MIGVTFAAYVLMNAAAPDVWAHAKALHRLHLNDDARGAIKDVIKAHPHLLLPAELMPLVDPYASADALRSSGFAQAADVALEKAVAQSLRPPPEERDAFRTVRALAAAGYYGEAEQELELVLRRGSATVPRNLRYLRPILLLTERQYQLLLSLTVLIVALGLLVIRRTRPLLFVDVFAPPTTDTAHFGQHLSVIVRSTLLQFSQQRPTNTTVITAPTAPVALPTDVVPLAAARDWLRVFALLRRALSVRRQLTLTAQLHPPSNRGVGVTATLTASGALLGTVTIWQNNFGPPANGPVGECFNGYLTLVDAIAIWTMFQLFERVK